VGTLTGSPSRELILSTWTTRSALSSWAVSPMSERAPRASAEASAMLSTDDAANACEATISHRLTTALMAPTTNDGMWSAVTRRDPERHDQHPDTEAESELDDRRQGEHDRRHDQEGSRHGQRDE
jgi:hypothetical protein